MEQMTRILAGMQAQGNRMKKYLSRRYPDEISDKEELARMIYPYKEGKDLDPESSDDDRNTIRKTASGYFAAFEKLAGGVHPRMNPVFETPFTRLEKESPIFAPYIYDLIIWLKGSAICLAPEASGSSYKVPLIHMPLFIVVVRMAYGKKHPDTQEKVYRYFLRELKNAVFQENGWLRCNWIREEDLFSLYYCNLLLFHQICRERISYGWFMQEILRGKRAAYYREMDWKEFRYPSLNEQLMLYEYGYYWNVFWILHGILEPNSHEELKETCEYKREELLLPQYDVDFRNSLRSSLYKTVSSRMEILTTREEKIAVCLKDSDLDRQEKVTRIEQIYRDGMKALRRSDGLGMDLCDAPEEVYPAMDSFGKEFKKQCDKWKDKDRLIEMPDLDAVRRWIGKSYKEHMRGYDECFRYIYEHREKTEALSSEIDEHLKFHVPVQVVDDILNELYLIDREPHFFFRMTNLWPKGWDSEIIPALCRDRDVFVQAVEENEEPLWGDMEELRHALESLRDHCAYVERQTGSRMVYRDLLELLLKCI